MMFAFPFTTLWRVRGPAAALRRPLGARSFTGLLVFAASAFAPMPAAADFRLCNNTGSRVGVAIGYKEGETWSTGGWRRLSTRSCESILRAPLVARF